MGVLSDWRAARDRRRLAALYLSRVLPASEPADAQWLASLGVDPELARRELAFVRRAIALIVAERDALDDRTASDVAHELSTSSEAAAHLMAARGDEWLVRWREYSDALATRGAAETPAARLGRVLLTGVGVLAPTAEQLHRATTCVHAMRVRANEALRSVFGAASLPDDVRPSAMRS